VSQELSDDVGRVMVDFTQMKAFSEDPLILTEGDGIRVRDVDGRWYIDGLSGTFCMSVGHGNARVVEAVTTQLSRLALAAPTMATSDRSLELARELLALLPSQYTTLKWGSGGSEAVEAAIKMARQFHRQAGDPSKYKVLSHYRAYHGVTGQALAASGWRSSKSPYEPLAAGFVHLHTPDPYRPPFEVDPADVGATYARLVEQVVELEGPETIAAVITEPILMTAGVVIPPAGYLPALRKLCDQHDIVLVFDEIITGFGRTGHLFAAELFSTWPDIFVFGKG
jgi:adenosylmethionine-8-amino-7-oxononanoate aminotransferase